MRCVLAHELAHIRLHFDEIEEGSYISSHDISEGFDDARFFQKEHEANIYSVVFMVPAELLAKCQPATLARTTLSEAGGSSDELWRLVAELARIFGTTRELMRMALELYGWVDFRPRRSTPEPEL